MPESCKITVNHRCIIETLMDLVECVMWLLLSAASHLKLSLNVF
jgi:hypothetical protein